jgi:hypothetical protein
LQIFAVLEILTDMKWDEKKVMEGFSQDVFDEARNFVNLEVSQSAGLTTVPSSRKLALESQRVHRFAAADYRASSFHSGVLRANWFFRTETFWNVEAVRAEYKS